MKNDSYYSDVSPHTFVRKKQKNEIRTRPVRCVKTKMTTRWTTPTTLIGVPSTHTNVKCDPRSVGECFAILCGVEHIEKEEPDTYKKLKMWSRILNKASEDQLERILQVHVTAICEILVGVIGEFHLQNMTEIFQHAIGFADDAVQDGKLKEGNYKHFCDITLWMINVLKAIDSYNNSDDLYDIGFTARHIKHKGRSVIDLYIYKPVSGTF